MSRLALLIVTGAIVTALPARTPVPTSAAEIEGHVTPLSQVWTPTAGSAGAQEPRHAGSESFPSRTPLTAKDMPAFNSSDGGGWQLPLILASFTLLASFALVGVTWWLAFQTKQLVKATVEGMKEQVAAAKEVLELQRKETSARLLLHMIDRWDTPTMDWDRADLATVANDPRFVGRMFDAPALSVPEHVLDFFETVGGLVKGRLIEVEMAWSVWGYHAPRWWKEIEGYVQHWRGKDQPAAWADFEHLKEEMIRLESEHTGEAREVVEKRLGNPKEQGIFLKEEMRRRPSQPPPGRSASPTRRPPFGSA